MREKGGWTVESEDSKIIRFVEYGRRMNKDLEREGKEERGRRKGEGRKRWKRKIVAGGRGQ